MIALRHRVAIPERHARLRFRRAETLSKQGLSASCRIPPLSRRGRQVKEGSYLLLWWQSLAEAVGITKTALRADAERERKTAIGDASKGCAWYRCVSYENDCDFTSLFRCERCRMALYCGLLCQKRWVPVLLVIHESSMRLSSFSYDSSDWEEGGHSARCHASAE